MKHELTRSNIPDILYASVASCTGETTKRLMVRIRSNPSTPSAEWCVEIEGKEKRYAWLDEAIAAYNAA